MSLLVFLMLKHPLDQIISHGDIVLGGLPIKDMFLGVEMPGNGMEMPKLMEVQRGIHLFPVPLW